MEFTLKPIAFVSNTRKEIKDDRWGEIVSKIKLTHSFNEGAFEGITEFSHLDIVFYFDQVTDEQIQYEARHPRNNKDFPKVGIFAQRGKNRPNKIGITTVELLEQNGPVLVVKGLDAIDGTPVIDIKPVMKEFLAKGEVKQPDWSISIMEKYWK
ncbi:tRNA (N6-threonylcarbamoyladenosine(37)-N6)-methyltransferase TrmO [Brevibacillus daliensis]|uniref:tRNA (N6-threonylcarbamoyladenosine(37)-N6)-methyltransferase TrmO n=1 Tax=Brevibacillus daliensis TaxID=2892995 RepID=UPI001E54EC50|nr:tRNA (N6-threonylcarbamoyladenosine(37)-N6)-methyltransferase TrmO [Brevibacillus daliensis]